MRPVDLIRAIEEFGCVLVRHRGKHNWYRNPTTGISQPKSQLMIAELVDRGIGLPPALAAMTSLEIEHIIPRTRGGSNAEANLWFVCLICHVYLGELGVLR
jgi:hypothetical protein